MLESIFFLIILTLIITLFSRSSRLEYRINELEDRLKKQKPLKETREPIAPALKPDLNITQEQTLPRTTTVKPHINKTESVVRNHSAEPETTALWQQHLKPWLESINSIALVGGIVLFIGVAFLLNLVAHSDFVSIQARLLASAFAAGGLLALSFKLNKRNPLYAGCLQGIALAIWYLLAASSYYHFHLFSASWALACLIAISVLCFGLAIKYNSRFLALIGIAGGFASPLIMPTANTDILLLFTFYLILNILILCIAWFKAWRELNVIGFLFTFCLTSFWHQQLQLPHPSLTTELFLAVFFLFYLFIPILYSSRQPPSLKGYVDSTLIFAMPLSVFTLQCALVDYNQWMLIYTCLAMGLSYLGCFAAIRLSHNKDYQLLAQSHLILSITFFTITCPLALSGTWSSLVWALEGAAIIWIGIKQQRTFPKISGSALQIAASLYYFCHHIFEISTLDTTFSSSQVHRLLITSLFSLIAFISAYGLYKNRKQHHWCVTAAANLFGLASTWLLFNSFRIPWLIVPRDYTTMARLIIFSIVAVTGFALGQRLKWPWLIALRHNITAMIFLSLGVVLLNINTANGLIFAWIIAFACQYGILHHHSIRHDAKEGSSHLMTLWLLTATILISGHRLFLNLYIDDNWNAGFSMLTLSSLITLCLIFGEEKQYWPYHSFRPTFIKAGIIPMVVLLLIKILQPMFTVFGIGMPFQYIPLLNPTETGTLAGLATLIYTLQCFHEQLQPNHRKIGYAVIATIGFVLVHVVILRTLRVYFGIYPYTRIIMESALAQTCFTVYYALTSLIIMTLARWKQQRATWFAGIILIGLTVLKLFLIDLANINTLNRIVSFIGLGALLLIIGYLAPLPPKKTLQQQPA